MERNTGNEYAWLSEYEKTWETLEEDEHGSIEQSVAGIIQRAKRKYMLGLSGSVQMGMMRHTLVVVDGSSAMSDRDMRPDRFQCSLKLVENFVKEFLDENPVAQVGLMLFKNRNCNLLSELSGNLKGHLKCLTELKKSFCEGDVSLYNAMEQAYKILKYLPGHTSREILIILGSITTIDQHDINDLIQEMKGSGIKCSIIGLSASIHVCQKICKETQGRYDVAIDETHFSSLLRGHLLPPVSPENQDCSLIKIGFPELSWSPNVRMILCMCNVTSTGMKECYGKGGYLCPQCLSKYCALPVECGVCGLMLASSAHLSRSHRHLFPLTAFEEVLTQNVGERNRYCYACQQFSKELNVYKCKKCCKYFCGRCDIFIHESLHSCPGCSSAPAPTNS